MSEKKVYVKEGRVCKVLKWSGKGEKPALYPRVGTLYIARDRVGRNWMCERLGGGFHLDLVEIPANCLAVVPEKEFHPKPTKRKAAWRDPRSGASA